MVDLTRLQSAYERAKADLLAERTLGGHWVGELSSSALSTATAVSALAMVRRLGWNKAAAAAGSPRPADGGPALADSLVPPYDFDNLIRRGVEYLVSQQNPDGGFGDTDLSHSNIATTYLVVAALHLAQRAVRNALPGVPDWASQRESLLRQADGYLEREGRLEGLRKRYGIDKTFVVPIMTNLALAGLVDWKEIDALPFELACVPQSWYRFVGMPVVSYAIPALVAIGQARYYNLPPRNPFTRLIRWLSITRSLKVLRRMQPDSGGYLEATPLTAFVVMSLASIYRSPLAPREEMEPPSSRDVAPEGDPNRISRSEMPTVADAVIRAGVQFLINSVRPDGSWPIDTNLATWNTTLAINALAGAPEDVAELLLPPAKAAGAVGNALRGVPSAGMEGEPTAPGTAQRPFPTGNLLEWLLSCQHTQRHPFTGADPGGFGWSDLSGAVPDADDTPGAMLALTSFVDQCESQPGLLLMAFFNSEDGLRWLMNLQNRNGGWPTFCRGWGKLPFDRSGTDLTAHAIRALSRWRCSIDDDERPDGVLLSAAQIDASVHRGMAFIASAQHPDGSWSPLWFGNQDHPEEDNPVYGTAKVLMAYRDLGLMDSPEAQRGVAWLVGNQNADGGWGSGVWQMRNAEFGVRNEERTRSAEPRARSGVEGKDLVTGPVGPDHSVPGNQYSVLSTRQDDAMPAKSQIHNLQSSVEETALAVEALLAACPRNAAEGVPYSAVARGLAWLIDRVEQNQHRQPAPIGFYFAKLWYYERLYPLTFTVAALGRACRQFARPTQLDSYADPASARAP